MLIESGFSSLRILETKKAFSYLNDARFDLRELLLLFSEFKPSNFESQRKNKNLLRDDCKLFLIYKVKKIFIKKK
jgi:hypothetical protein